MKKFIFSSLFLLNIFFMISVFANNNIVTTSEKENSISTHIMQANNNQNVTKQSSLLNIQKQTNKMKKIKNNDQDNIKTNTSDVSAIQQRITEENKVKGNPYAVSFYEQTYVLPYYHTFSPYKEIYNGNTPNNQDLESNEFKAQFSIQIPLWSNINKKPIDLNLGYTQLMFWQFYARSQYFRETDYQPELFVSWHAFSNWLVRFGVVHESNGRGGEYERSWNRIYTDVRFSGNHWLVSLKPWVLVFRPQSSNLHNSDIADYLGNGRTLFAYKMHKMVFSLWVRNAAESLFRRAAYQADISFPIYGYIHGYLQYFTGYGQSLIEYNHKTKAIGVGIIISNWF